MKIPNFIDNKFVDEKGKLTSEWSQIMMQLFNELQTKASDEGIFVPQQDTTNLAKLDNAKSLGALVYDSDTHELKVNINGTFKVIQTS